MKRIALLVFALLACAPASACINEIATDYKGGRLDGFQPLAAELEQRVATQPLDAMLWLRDRKRVIAAARAQPGLSELTDLGILLIAQGQYNAAAQHFMRIERLFPGHAETAGNLGTALELGGHDAVALRWIRIGIRRNVQEHQGSEWLHARILETKLALARDPEAMRGRSIAGLVFEPWTVPPLPRSAARDNGGHPLTARGANSALAYQLYERLVFVKPKDPVVANLLEDAATLNLAGGSIEDALGLYALALSYGAEHTPLMQKREAYIRRVLARSASVDGWTDGDCAVCREDVTLPPVVRR